MYLKILQYRFDLSDPQWSKMNSIFNRKPLKMYKEDNCIITQIFF